jgi:GTPase SAR1 family protein
MKEIPCSCIDTINITRIVILSKAVYKFSEIIIRNCDDTIHRNRKNNSKTHMTTQMTAK